ncbi:MAG: AMP-binding protein [Longimicrobiales bacterium]|jgi:O-succinylbenzoic acid--CoA ligase
MATDVLQAVLDRGADPESLALLSPDSGWTLAGLQVAVHQKAAELKELIEQGQVYPLIVHQDVDSVIDMLALWQLGVTPAPLNPKLTQAELAAAKTALSGVRSEAQAIVWTSGTAGRPRGVEVSFAGLSANAEASAARLLLTDDDVWAASLSFAHVGGLALLVRALLLGSDLVVLDAFDARRLNEALEGRGLPIGYNRPVTHVSLVPTQLKKLLDERGDEPAPKTARCVLTGGAHAPMALVGRAGRLGWPIALTYGMTEMTSQVATADPALTRLKPGTVGAPLNGTEVHIAPDDEIMVRGATLVERYVGADEVSILGDDGWYHTGDLGRIDEDGHLWVTGRRGERIISGGVTVDAIEVEEVLRAHPAVVDAVVAAIPDDEWGEIVGAFVVGVEGEFDLDAVAEHARSLLSDAKRPRRWLIDHELPLNANGKVDRVLVAAFLRDAEA